ncbi:MAG: hypothetical protein QOE11_2715 [Solirubrobacteraceae bacterium]|jgi:hypothetical protein|nr:hypothetical protein [Solirubrobacteraceae bacterium]
MALRIAATVFVLGVLAVWLVAPIGNACPDVGRLPSGSRSSSSPSLSPPLTRRCTYTTPEGTQAHARYVPWLDWIVLALLAAVVSTLARFVRAPAPREQSAAAPRERPVAAPRAARESLRRDDTRGRDQAERERARQERAERARRRD